MSMPHCVTTVEGVPRILPAPSSEVVAGARHAAWRELT
jgi:hypothetical protein